MEHDFTQILQEGIRLKDKLIPFRRDLHRYPELSFQESRTAAKVASWLSELGLTVKTGIGGQGVTADLEGKFPGPTIALRADMDALPIQEETKLPFSSERPGIMHACGHDVHTTILLGAASLLVGLRERLAGKVRFIFQSAEEILEGAGRMINEGILEDIDEIYGLHNLPSLPVGKVGVRPGPVMASIDRLQINVEGQGGHGSMPEQCMDPIVASSAIIMGLQTVVSREFSCQDPIVISIGSIHAGNANNVIPSAVEMAGTVRTYSELIRDSLEERIRRLVENIAAGYRCKAHVKYIRQVPPVVNDEVCSRRFSKWIEAFIGNDGLKEVPPSMGGEDFALFLQQVPGCYFWLGSGSLEGEDQVYGLHSPHFVVNEDCIPLGATILAAFTCHRLEQASTRL